MSANNVVLQKLIQNHYELYGSFQGIERRKYYSNIILWAQHAKMSVEEFLYTSLGYVSTSLCTAAQMQGVRLAIMHNSQSELEKVLGTGVTLQQVIDLFKAEDLMPVNVTQGRTSQNIPHLQYVCLLADYYESCQECKVLWNGALSPIGYVLYSQRNEKGGARAKASALMKSPEINMALVKFKKCDCTEPKISCGVFYVNEDLSEYEQGMIQKNALVEVIQPSLELNTKLIKEFSSLVSIASSDPKTYLSILEYAKDRGITYASILKQLGLNLPDYQEAYLTFGFIPVCYGDVVAIYSETGVSEIATSQFIDICRAQTSQKLEVF